MPPWEIRERGSLDLRWFLAAVSMWVGVLAASSEPFRTAVLVAALCCVLPLSAAAAWRRTMAGATYAATLGVCAAAIAAGMGVGAAHVLHRMADPVMTASAASGTTATLRMRLDSPVQASSMRGAACKAQATVLALHHDGVAEASGLPVLAMLPQEACSTLGQGATVMADATVARSPYDAQAVWVTVSDVHDREPAPWWWRTADWVRSRFFAVAARLDADSRILVPGVTLGVLGQDTVGAWALDVDTERADQLEEQCKRAGILHLMAVSGGHYALLGPLVHALGAWLRTPWRLTALWRLPLAGALTMVLVPSQSVTRAAIGALLAMGFECCGRRPQTLHILALTVILALMQDPGRATHVGFALSCAAVAGIALLAPSLTAVLGRMMPRGVAQALAVTIAAQAFTLPIQMVMDPSIARWALPANLLVGPCMDVATVFGLLACACAIASPELAILPAQVSAWGTKGIAMVAGCFGADPSAGIPWVSGWAGILAIIAVELASGASLWCLAQLVRAWRLLRGGEDFRDTTPPTVRTARWIRDTIRTWDRLPWWHHG
ncbi:ComEC/Rec2 family competence protein [Bifidobacterium cuniculi]|uniref:ComEC/Rec2-like protein n=1 Tax=Bifidobacterium cuniculi TaxID=1688 RepID=A0A087AQE5_9BIFI|nr:ComEC/Rec2 family competence protein [Bifidobacterium cuniculi]KFI60995.1 ComEC/Rec2-like protein [Bifidobacterium cuniculi]